MSMFPERLLTMQGGYAARVHSLRSYDAVSRDVVQRWAFPFCPDLNWMPAGGQPTAYTLSRQHVYRYAEQTLHTGPWHAAGS